MSSNAVYPRSVDYTSEDVSLLNGRQIGEHGSNMSGWGWPRQKARADGVGYRADILNLRTNR